MVALGLGYIEYKIALEEISRVCGSVGLRVAAHNSLCTGHIHAVWYGRTEKEILAQACFCRMDRGVGADRSEYRVRRVENAMRCRRRKASTG